MTTCPFDAYDAPRDKEVTINHKDACPWKRAIKKATHGTADPTAEAIKQRAARGLTEIGNATESHDRAAIGIGVLRDIAFGPAKGPY